MEKIRGYIYFVFATAVVLIFLFLAFNSNINAYSIYSPPQISDCSTASIKAVWDSIFLISSDNIIIMNSSSSSGCNNFIAYKNVSGDFYYLGNSNYSASPTLSAFKIIFNSSGVPLAISILSLNQNLNMNILSTSVINRGIISSNSADTEFRSVFRLASSAWTANFTSSQSTFFYNNLSNSGLIDANKSIDSFVFINVSSACTPTWQQVTNSCDSNNTYLTWYNDTNSCNILPDSSHANFTSSCSFGNIVGDSSSITANNFNVTVFVDGTSDLSSVTLTNNSFVQMEEGNITRISFYYNSSGNLDLTGISIEKQNSSSDFGYLLVSGLNVEKNITIDKINSSSTQVCAKNSHVLRISDMSDDCSNSGEILLDCPGFDFASNLSCTIGDSTFTISGLTSSAVREILPSKTCTPDWFCGDWGNCLNGNQTKTCTDSNSCNPQNTTYTSTQQCVSSCVSNWSCADWSICNQNGTQTRTCTDSNSCSSGSANIPLESQECSPSNFSTRSIVTFMLILILIIAVIGVIYYIIKIRKAKNNLQPIQQINPYQPI